jgi:sn-glycerol 3-phosphate transport system substrate-binding protein
LQGTALTKATQGCLLGVMPQVRKGAERAMQAAVLSGTDPKTALQNEETTLHGPINDYNSSVGG